MANKTVTAAPEIEIGIAEKNRQATAEILNTLLADEFVLYVKTRKFHWNVTGIHFRSLHLFFETQYKQLDEMIDSVAERTRKIGHFATATMQQFLDEANLVEHIDDNTSDKVMVQVLTDDHETLIRSIRNHIETIDQKYKDAGTADFLTQLMEQHETMAWMLRAQIEG